MCLIVFAYNHHPDYKLILAANRDEFYQRPTAAAHWWKDHPKILGGRDLQANGTWMGVTKQGRFAAVTNYRDLSNIRDDARSRGELPTDFLVSTQPSSSYVREVNEKEKDYNGFNLLVLAEEMGYVSNYEKGFRVLGPGIYGLSNALLDTPWKKVEQAKKNFLKSIEAGVESADLMNLMQDDSLAPDDELPETGLDYQREKALSAMCIRTPEYGTCCTTVLTIDHEGRVNFTERSYPVGDRTDQVVDYTFKVTK